MPADQGLTSDHFHFLENTLDADREPILLSPRGKWLGLNLEAADTVRGPLSGVDLEYIYIFYQRLKVTQRKTNTFYSWLPNSNHCLNQ